MSAISVYSERQNHRCCYCGVVMLLPSEPGYDARNDRMATREHVEPKSIDPRTRSIVAACKLCNQGRGDLDADLYLSLVLAHGRYGARTIANRFKSWQSKGM